MGEIHGDNVQSKEVTTSLAVYVGVTDQTALAAGTVVSGLTVTIDHVSTLAHKSNTATPIATKTRKYTFTSGRKHPVMCSCKTVYSAAGGINIEYPIMLPVGELVNAYKGMSQPHFNKYYIGHVETPILGLNDNTVSTRRLICSCLGLWGIRLKRGQKSYLTGLTVSEFMGVTEGATRTGVIPMTRLMS